MSLLSRLRQGTDSVAFKALFFIIVIVFVFWGVGAGNMASTQTYATVDGRRITSTDFNRIMRSQNLASTATEDERAALGRQVMDSLIRERVLSAEAMRLGIEVSATEVDREIANIPDFLDDNGTFAPTLFERNLKRMGYTQGNFEAEVRKALTLQKLFALVSMGIGVSDAEVDQAWMRQSTSLTMRTVMLPDDAVRRAVDVDETSIDALLASDRIDIEARYQADLGRRYEVPTQATLRTILLRSDIEGSDLNDLRSRIDGIRAQLVDGADFETLARAWSEDLTAASGGLLGKVALAQLDPVIALEIESLATGDLSQVVETGRGLQVLFVEEKVDGKTIPIGEVEREIAREILADQMLDSTGQTLARSLLDVWRAGGDPPHDLMDRLGLQLEVGGPAPLSRPFGLPPSNALLDAASAQGGPGLLDGVYTMPGGLVIGEVVAFDRPAADDPMVVEQRDFMRMALERAKEQSFMDAWTRDAVARAKVVQFFNP